MRSRGEVFAGPAGPMAFALLLGGCGPAPDADARSAPVGPEPDVDAEILWDRYGVPHVFAAEMDALFHAFGWA